MSISGLRQRSPGFSTFKTAGDTMTKTMTRIALTLAGGVFFLGIQSQAAFAQNTQGGSFATWEQSNQANRATQQTTRPVTVIADPDLLGDYYGFSYDWRQRAIDDLARGRFYRDNGQIVYVPDDGSDYTPRQRRTYNQYDADTAAVEQEAQRAARRAERQAARQVQQQPAYTVTPLTQPRLGYGWEGQSVDHLAVRYGYEDDWRERAFRDLQSGAIDINGNVYGPLTPRLRAGGEK